MHTADFFYDNMKSSRSSQKFSCPAESQWFGGVMASSSVSLVFLLCFVYFAQKCSK